MILGYTSFENIFFVILYNSPYLLFIYCKLTSNATQHAAKNSFYQSAYGQKMVI
jgi:hypothetical protein